MIPLVLHGILHRSTPLPASAGAHLRITAGTLIGIATEATPRLLRQGDEPPLPDAEQHHTLLSCYAYVGEVRPVRFGAVFSGKAALARAISREATVHLAWLQDMSRHVEYTLKLSLGQKQTAAARADPSVCPDDGGAFLARKRLVRDERRRLSTRRSDFARSLVPSLRANVAEARQLSSADPDTLAQFALLVDRKRVALMIEQARLLSHEAADLSLEMALRGPGPCYGFADGRDTRPVSAPLGTGPSKVARNG